MYILGIETSCDDTSAAVLFHHKVCSNVIAGQEVHRQYGGVVPELASRAHQQHIVPVVEAALRQANVTKNQLGAVAYTRGPGLLGSLLVGSSFAKSLSIGLGIPLIDVDHMEAHIFAHFLEDEQQKRHPELPFICLTVSGGHTQIVKVNEDYRMQIIGRTIDDAAGEAFDKAAKIMGLPYPGGPVIDKLAQDGNPFAFDFAEPRIPGYDYSFSGLKTSILYFLRDQLKTQPDFIELHKADLCASIQRTIVDILMKKLTLAARAAGIRQVAVAGGVSANSALRHALTEAGVREGWEVYIPRISYTTDNAAMIAVAGLMKYRAGYQGTLDLAPYTRQLTQG
ncbi:MAG: tRNA (adenosine(37)-N6)-threonylcarbamoyltransferase complex transferase subunit TsaD [Bacteroidetes bacterium]|nr:tRNA (adenosine(37)-N6)-threonylcarbamoyltransferase complex transferase subunit TsaD [Bacteroidota bacterium]